MKRYLLLLLAIAAPSAAQLVKQKIHIECICNDPVGAEYATALRDAIAQSPRYELAASASQGTGKDLTYNWDLRIATVDDGTPTSRGYSTAISVVLVVGDIYISHQVQVCGRDMISDCARRALSWVDGTLQQ